MGNAPVKLELKSLNESLKSKVDESIEKILTTVRDCQAALSKKDWEKAVNTLEQMHKTFLTCVTQEGINESDVFIRDQDIIQTYIEFIKTYQQIVLKIQIDFKKLPSEIYQNLIEKNPYIKKLLEKADKIESIYATALEDKLKDLARDKIDFESASEAAAAPMTNTQIVAEKDSFINFFPSPRETSNSIKHITLGDMHGNALKLIYSLAREGFLTLSPDQYQTLHTIYYSTPLTKLLIDEFKTIIDAAPCNTTRAFTLIGDVLCDRGSNDYLTLLVLNKLKNTGLDIDILLSNHDAEFINDYEQEQFTGRSTLGGSQGASLTSMKALIDSGLITEAQVRELVASSYIPMVKLFSYTISDDKTSMSIFAHALVGLEVIEKFAEVFGIPYAENTIDDLKSTIDAINAKINQLLINKQLSLEIIKELKAIGYYDEIKATSLKVELDLQGFISPKTPIHRTIWSRDPSDIRTLSQEKRPLPYRISFVHGHVGEEEDLHLYPTHTNIDTGFGKKSDTPQGLYLIRQSSERTLNMLLAPTASRIETDTAHLAFVATGPVEGAVPKPIVTPLEQVRQPTIPADISITTEDNDTLKNLINEVRRISQALGLNILPEKIAQRTKELESLLSEHIEHILTAQQFIEIIESANLKELQKCTIDIFEPKLNAFISSSDELIDLINSVSDLNLQLEILNIIGLDNLSRMIKSDAILDELFKNIQPTHESSRFKEQIKSLFLIPEIDVLFEKMRGFIEYAVELERHFKSTANEGPEDKMAKCRALYDEIQALYADILKKDIPKTPSQYETLKTIKKKMNLDEFVNFITKILPGLQESERIHQSITETFDEVLRHARGKSTEEQVQQFDAALQPLKKALSALPIISNIDEYKDSIKNVISTFKETPGHGLPAKLFTELLKRLDRQPTPPSSGHGLFSASRDADEFVNFITKILPGLQESKRIHQSITETFDEVLRHARSRGYTEERVQQFDAALQPLKKALSALPIISNIDEYKDSIKNVISAFKETPGHGLPARVFTTLLERLDRQPTPPSSGHGLFSASRDAGVEETKDNAGSYRRT